MNVTKDSSIGGGLVTEQIYQYEGRIKELEKELKEATRQNKDLDTQADRLSENLRMEQETCNNLLETMKA